MRSLLFHILIILLVNNGLPTLSFGQKVPDNEILIQKLVINSKKHPANLLFVHTDKNIYTNNEDLWFSAYLIKSESVAFKFHNILSTALIREDDHKIYLDKKFAMIKGSASGSITLPDTIPPGNYQLLAYTNVNGKDNLPLALFYQSITIKSITQTDFSLQLSLLDSVAQSGKISVQARIEILNPPPKKVIKPVLEYNPGGHDPKIVKLNGDNMAIITIPSLEQQNILNFKARYNEQVKYGSLVLPGAKIEGVKVGFYPEGGYMTNGILGKIGLESKTINNRPIPVSGILFQDEIPIDTLVTNSYGMGSFFLTPNSKSQYSLRIKKNGYTKSDTTFYLPPALKDGIGLQILRAAVNDTLRFRIKTSGDKKLKVIIHDYKDGYATFDISGENNKSNTQTVILTGVPKGLCTITITDQAGYPLAERIFFAHYDRRNNIDFTTNQKTFSKREKVSVNLKLTDFQNKPVKGIFSVSCVQDNRFDPARQQDIETFSYLTSELGVLPVDPVGRGFGNTDYIENILLVKGWRKYSWQELMNNVPGDTISNYNIQSISGKVQFFGKNLKKPVSVTVMKDVSEFNLIETSEQGFFDIPIENLTVPEEKIIQASVNEKNKDGYTINTIDPFPAINSQLSGQLPSGPAENSPGEMNSGKFELSGMDHVTLLNEVTIRSGGGDNSLYGRKKGPNACGDYVVGERIYYSPTDGSASPYYNIQTAKTAGSPPQKGVRYIDGMKGLYDNGVIDYLGRGTAKTFVIMYLTYDGCIVDKDKSIFKLGGIYTTREFYGFDEKLKDFSDPQLLSTIYWNPKMVIDEKGEAVCSFYSSDITGKFRVTIQGVGTDDLIYGETFFTVK